MDWRFWRWCWPWNCEAPDCDDCEQEAEREGEPLTQRLQPFPPVLLIPEDAIITGFQYVFEELPLPPAYQDDLDRPPTEAQS